MPASFDISFAKSGSAEGGYSNRSVDRGGETYRGVSRVYNPSWLGWPIIDKAKMLTDFPQRLSADQVLDSLIVAFYRGLWGRLHCQSFPTQELANIVFDTAILCGETTAVIYLQRSLNALNKQGKFWADIGVDGKPGPVTSAAINKAAASAYLLVTAMAVIRGYAHLTLAEKDPSQEENMRGWLSRLIEFLPKTSN
jgi:lysozyme family protein